MSKVIKLKENRDFRRLYRRGMCFAHPALVTYVAKSRRPFCRVGVTTGKKIGGAVERNRARRIILAAYRELMPEINGSFDFVFVARSRTPDLKSTDIGRVMLAQLRDAGCIGGQAVNNEKNSD